MADRKSRKKSEIISDFIKLMNEAERVYGAAYNAVNTEDKLTSDLLHRLELDGTNCGSRYHARYSNGFAPGFDI